ncbi:MAG: YkgJ family cysteine cluster protein [Kiritimatiellae bacterium]|nr:YkgJ family cysteine cluster protein [Kiritimatiellia bacterium]
MTKTKYVCMRCGNCCRWPGYVRLTQADVDNISAFLQITEREFTRKYTTLTSDRRMLSLTEQEDGSCIFLDGNTCIVHAVKPEQCRGFPNKWAFHGFERSCQAKKVVVEDEEQQAVPADA